MVVDLSECASPLSERPLKDIRAHLQSSLKGTEHTKAIEIKAMSRDNRQNHRYFVFVTTQVEESLLRIHIDEWLVKAFPKARIQATTFYPIRADSVNGNAILDSSTGRILPEATLGISKDNDNLSVGRIGWLSLPGKKYGSMVVYLKDKSEADAILTRGFLEVGGESATTQVWEERGKVEQRCFNCQKYGHLARGCKDMTVCGNCAQKGHYHQDCMTTTPKCANCGGNHRAKDHGRQQRRALSGSRADKKPESQRSNIPGAPSAFEKVLLFTESGNSSQANQPATLLSHGAFDDLPLTGNG